jgi:hypothetical protein
MKLSDYSPEMEALVSAIGSLREHADAIEEDDTYLAGSDMKRWDLSPAEMKRQHRRAAAHRALANNLELKVLQLMRNKKRDVHK